MHTFYTIFNRFLSSLSLSLSLSCVGVSVDTTHIHHNFFACYVKHAKKQNPPPPLGRVLRREAARAVQGGQHKSTVAHRVPRTDRAGQQMPGRVGSARKAGRPRARGQMCDLPPPGARAIMPSTPRAGQDDAARAHKDPLYVLSAAAAARSP